MLKPENGDYRQRNFAISTIINSFTTADTVGANNNFTNDQYHCNFKRGIAVPSSHSWSRTPFTTSTIVFISKNIVKSYKTERYFITPAGSNYNDSHFYSVKKKKDLIAEATQSAAPTSLPLKFI